MEQSYILKLFVAGNNDKAQRIYDGLVEVLQGIPPEIYELELVDVLIHPDKAMEFGVFATPTLIKALPEPLRRVVGKMDDHDSLVLAVELVRS